MEPEKRPEKRRRRPSANRGNRRGDRRSADSNVLQGNEACAKGAIHAGCRFFAGYPITPSTEIIELLASEMPRAGGAFIQMEDEIGSACSIIGARWGGVRAMTATSGPGFSLMQEAIGFAASTETPVVFVNVQRGGPSTGQPTLSAQQDIYQARYGSHGDYEIISLAPSSVQEMYDFTIRAFELSEKYRTPVILLSDEEIGHMREKVVLRDAPVDIDDSPKDYVKSPQTDFFKGAMSTVEGQLHDEKGRRIGHMPVKSGQFIEDICKKITDHIDDISDVDTYCMDDADIAIIAYGSVARPAMNAVKLARGIRDDRIFPRFKLFKDLFTKGLATARQTDYSHLQVGLIKVNTVWPCPDKLIAEAAKDVKTVIVPEMNMGKYVREIQRILPDKHVIPMPKVGGDLHSPAEILDRVLEEVGINE